MTINWTELVLYSPRFLNLVFLHQPYDKIITKTVRIIQAVPQNAQIPKSISTRRKREDAKTFYFNVKLNHKSNCYRI